MTNETLHAVLFLTQRKTHSTSTALFATCVRVQNRSMRKACFIQVFVILRSEQVVIFTLIRSFLNHIPSCGTVVIFKRASREQSATKTQTVKNGHNIAILLQSLKSTHGKGTFVFSHTQRGMLTCSQAKNIISYLPLILTKVHYQQGICVGHSPFEK